MVEGEVDAAFFGIVTEGHQYAVEMVNHVATLQIQCFATSIQTAEVEQSAHLAQQQLCVLSDTLQHSQQIIGRTPLLHLLDHLLQRRDDERERSAQVVADVGKELQLHLGNLLPLLSFHQLSLTFCALPLPFPHHLPKEECCHDESQQINHVHRQCAIERRCHTDAQFARRAHRAIFTANTQLKGVVARRQSIERHFVFIRHDPVAHLPFQSVGIAYALHVLQTSREEPYAQVGIVMMEPDGTCQLVEQTVTDGNPADHHVVLLPLRCHQPSWIDAHVSFCSSHEYLALRGTDHGIAIEIELGHTHVGQEVAPDEFHAVGLAFWKDGHHIPVRGTEPIASIVVESHALDDIVGMTNVVKRIPLRIENRDAIGMRQ